MQGRRVRARNRDGHHLRKEGVRGKKGFPEIVRDGAGGGLGKRPAVARDAVPALIASEGQGIRDREPGRGVARSPKLKGIQEGAVTQRPGVVRCNAGLPAVTDDPRRQKALRPALNVQEPRALGRHQPLVAVAGIEVGAKRPQRQGNKAGGVRPVDDGDDPLLPRCGDRPCHRQDQRGRGCDMAQEQNTRAHGQAGEDRIGKLRLRHQRQGHLDPPELRTRPAADEVPGLVERRVFVIGRQNLVPRPKRQGPRDKVQPFGRVGRPEKIARLRAKFVRKRRANLGKTGAQVARVHEGDRLALQRVLPPALRRDDGAGTGPVGSVVEEGNGRVDGKQVLKSARHDRLRFQRRLSPARGK